MHTLLLSQEYRSSSDSNKAISRMSCSCLKFSAQCDGLAGQRAAERAAACGWSVYAMFVLDLDRPGGSPWQLLIHAFAWASPVLGSCPGGIYDRVRCAGKPGRRCS